MPFELRRQVLANVIFLLLDGSAVEQLLYTASLGSQKAEKNDPYMFGLFCLFVFFLIIPNCQSVCV